MQANRLTFRQIIRLTNHVISCGDSCSVSTLDELAREASRSLGFRVTPSNLRTVLRAVGLGYQVERKAS